VVERVLRLNLNRISFKNPTGREDTKTTEGLVIKPGDGSGRKTDYKQFIVTK
jgi:hypothetical protein